MSGHFRAFSFVDRITETVPGASIHGCYVVPPAVDAFPVSLVAEAVGQIAAWAGMAEVGFTHRPVAGIAGRIELLSSVRPGQVLELAAELECVDHDMVGYSGTAKADGLPVIRLLNCVGPMVPIADYDDPAAVRDRFRLLREAGAAPGGFGGLPALPLHRDPSHNGEFARARLEVPADAPFFADHFPRRPVFPGTLLMHAQLQTAAWAAAEVGGAGAAGGAAWRARAVRDVKLRTFVAPGESLELEARRSGQSPGCLRVAVESRGKGRLIGSAEIEFTPEPAA